MINSDQARQDHNSVLKLLQGALGQMQTIVGTSMAEALGAALQVDRRLRGDATGAQLHLKLSVDEITELALHLNWALETENVQFELPLGSLVTSRWSSGSIEIDGEHLTLDAGRNGLFPVETTPYDAHGPNLVLLCKEIERLTRRLACRRLGVPEPTQIFSGHVQQLIKFPPLAAAGGVVLQRSVATGVALHFCAASPTQIKRLAKETVLDMRILWSNRIEIGRQVQEVRQAAVAAIKKVSPGTDICSISVDIKHQCTSTSYVFDVAYESVEETMRPGPYIIGVAYHDELSSSDINLHDMTRFQEIRDELDDLGADGWIDDFALGLLNAAPEGRGLVLERLAKSYETVIAIPIDNKMLYAWLVWRYGKITSYFSIMGKLEWYGEYLDVLGVIIPEVTVQQFAGQPLSCLVELPFDSTSDVLEVTNLPENRVRIELDLPTHLINIGTGRTWPQFGDGA